MRKLLYIPTYHSFDETVISMQPMIDLDPETFEGIARKEDAVWQSIDEALATSTFDFAKTKIFAEGLVYALGEPEEVLPFDTARQAVEEFFASKNLEHRQYGLLTAFHLAGATFIVSEDVFYIEANIECYQEVQDIALAEAKKGDLDEEMDEEIVIRFEELMERIEQLKQIRDDLCAERVNAELQDGETGIVIFGMMHDILSRLDPDIAISFISPEVEAEWRIIHEGGNSLENIARIWDEGGGFRGIER